MNDLMNDLISTTVRNRAPEMAETLTTMNSLLYGDYIRWEDRPLWERIKIRLAGARKRITDAWGVLIGTHEVGEW